MSLSINKLAKSVKFILPYTKNVRQSKVGINKTYSTTKRSENTMVTEKSQNNNEEINEYNIVVITFMKSMAMLPLFTNSSSQYLGLINILYILFVDFMSGHIMIFSMADLYFSWDGDVFSLTFNMINTIIYIMNTTLLVYFQIKWKKLNYILKKFDESFRFTSAPGLTSLNMRPSYAKTRLYSIMFSVSCIISAMHWAVLPLITPSEDGVRVLPLKIWYPIDVQATPRYEIAYATQVFCQIMVAICFSNYGIFFMSECILICGQFDILCCSLRNIRFTALLAQGFEVEDLITISGYQRSGPDRCTLPEDEQGQYFCGNAQINDPGLEIIDLEDLGGSNLDVKSFDGDNNSALETDYYEAYDTDVLAAIKECAIHHQQILDYCDSMKRFCSTISLLKMVQITFLVCFIMYSFSVSFQITILEYGTLACTDLFLLCYFGNEIMIRSSKVGTAVCGGPWQMLNPRARRDLLPILIRTSRPVYFTGGKFYMLTLENFISVLKVSFSYFTLLRNINETRSGIN